MTIFSLCLAYNEKQQEKSLFCFYDGVLKWTQVYVKKKYIYRYESGVTTYCDGMTKQLFPERKLLNYCRLYRWLKGMIPCSVLPLALCALSLFLHGSQYEDGLFNSRLGGTKCVQKEVNIHFILLIISPCSRLVFSKA